MVSTIGGVLEGFGKAVSVAVGGAGVNVSVAVAGAELAVAEGGNVNEAVGVAGIGVSDGVKVGVEVEVGVRVNVGVRLAGTNWVGVGGKVAVADPAGAGVVGKAEADAEAVGLIVAERVAAARVAEVVGVTRRGLALGANANATKPKQ